MRTKTPHPTFANRLYRRKRRISRLKPNCRRMAPAVVANESLTSDVASRFAAERAAQYMPRRDLRGGKLAGCMSIERENNPGMGASERVRVGLAGMGRFGKLHAS